MKNLLKRLRDRLVARFRMFLRIPANYVGDNGCVRAAATFAAWNQVEGDYLEFEVWRGYSFVTAYQQVLAERESHHRLGYNTAEYTDWKSQRPRFFAFDSFQGLPSGDAARMVDYGVGAYACSRGDFVTNLQDQGVDLNDVVIVEGLYDRTCVDETKRSHNLKKAAIVMIDCDLYESTVPVLDFLTDLVQQGTILIFDDWFRFKGNPAFGEQRACREWLARNPQIELVEFWRQGPQAVAFLVNLKTQ